MFTYRLKEFKEREFKQAIVVIVDVWLFKNEELVPYIHPRMLLILESKSSKKKRGNNNRKDDSDNESKQIVIAQVLCLFAYWLISCICIDPISTQINLIWEYKRT